MIPVLIVVFIFKFVQGSCMMTGVSEVPVVEVHASNIVELWPSLVHAIRSSTFVAIDTVSWGLSCQI